VVLFTAGAPEKPLKTCSPGTPALKSIRESEVRLLYSVVLITTGAPKNPLKTCSLENPAAG
jgi:hypothetical protein